VFHSLPATPESSRNSLTSAAYLVEDGGLFGGYDRKIENVPEK